MSLLCLPYISSRPQLHLALDLLFSLHRLSQHTTRSTMQQFLSPLLLPSKPDGELSKVSFLRLPPILCTVCLAQLSYQLNARGFYTANHFICNKLHEQWFATYLVPSNPALHHPTIWIIYPSNHPPIHQQHNKHCIYFLSMLARTLKGGSMRQQWRSQSHLVWKSLRCVQCCCM